MPVYFVYRADSAPNEKRVRRFDCATVFDWAAAHPTLASGILTFASRWDVLS